MNTIPHPRETRHFFYSDVTDSLLSTLEEGQLTRLSMNVMIPELNPQNDVYRVGTMLELVRGMASALVQDGKRVRVCVQGSMGKGVFQGLPLQLNGVRKLLDLMDWHEDVAYFISFGAIGAAEVKEEDDLFIIIAPQNIIGASVQPSLEAMCEAAGDRPVVLLNPNLVDIPSAGNVMQVRGREERLEFVDQFKEIYHFRLLYRKPYFHPIFGCLRYTYPNSGRWEVYKRVVQKTGLTGRAGKEEKYCFAKAFDNNPKPSLVTQAIAMDLSF
jgi:adenylate kinase